MKKYLLTILIVIIYSITSFSQLSIDVLVVGGGGSGGNQYGSGGTVTTSGSYTIHTFTTSGTFSATAPPSGKKINGITYTKWNNTTISKWNNQ